MADPITSSGLNNRRRRAMIACTNCRRRKIKCITTEEPPKNPCARCTKRSLPCEYVAVEEDSPTPDTTVSLPPGQYSSPPAYGMNGYDSYAPASSQYGVPWNASQHHHHSVPAHPEFNSSYMSSSSSLYGPGPNSTTFGGPGGYSDSGYHPQQQFPAGSQNQWMQGPTQQQLRCLCPNSSCPFHR
ncbi:hypothetical protein B0H15DRAFT_104663 [Mycena belliarum]|uniref:Zn(2)-C6 fungal-type domain-containing protein n=1 Tax=Mycena belliarum TaxID=1033014 RepID=A0AAD6UCC4_9AGAR|nr:hypothetical protein B0H15DRAFT_104663 [Mycena belliae]